MAEKTLNTRIRLKYDTLANWTEQNPTLYAGEIAIVAVPTESSTTVEQVTKPAVVFKVGDGTSTFNNLPYASGLAADVYAWAKATEKPSYSINEIEGWSDEILDDEIKSLITDALTEFLQSENFESQVIADVTESVNTALDTAESYADTAIQNLGSVTASEGSYISGISITEEGNLTITEVALSGTYYNKTEIDSKLDTKQNTLTFDTTPAEESQNPVTSGGIYSAIQTAVETAEEYTNAAIADVVRYSVEVYDSYDNLPNHGSSGVIYFVACEHEEGKDIYDEYIWIQPNGSSDDGYYEKIGNTDIDLTDYATKEELGEAVSTINEATEAISARVTTLEGTVGDAEKGLVKDVTDLQNSVTEIETDYAKTADVTTAISEAIQGLGEADVADGNYITGVKVNESGKIEITEKTLPETDLTDYYTKEETNDAIKEAVSGVEKYTAEAGDGLKVTTDSETNTGTTNFKVEIDDSVTFIFDCGSASTD